MHVQYVNLCMCSMLTYLAGHNLKQCDLTDAFSLQAAVQEADFKSNSSTSDNTDSEVNFIHHTLDKKSQALV